MRATVSRGHTGLHGASGAPVGRDWEGPPAPWVLQLEKLRLKDVTCPLGSHPSLAELSGQLG